MSIRNNPKPGEFLFIGGGADGERREVAQPCKAILISPFPKSSVIDLDLSGTPEATCAIIRQEYLLTQIRGHESSFFVYLHSSLTGGDMMKALIRRYTGAKHER